jgi:hypothetical protein
MSRRSITFSAVVNDAGEIVPEDASVVNRLKTLTGRRVHVVVSTERVRSVAQNRYYWSCIVRPLAAEFGYSDAEMHEILLSEHSREYADNPLAPPRIVRTSEMTTADAEEYYERVRRWAAVHHGIVLQSPGDYQSGV